MLYLQHGITLLLLLPCLVFLPVSQFYHHLHLQSTYTPQPIPYTTSQLPHFDIGQTKAQLQGELYALGPAAVYCP